MPKAKQLMLDDRPWGGKRKGAGRKLQARRPSVEHHPRKKHPRRSPAHVTVRLRPSLPTLRCAAAHRAVLRSIVLACTPTFRVVHYSVMSNHVHLICEADDLEALRRGVSALIIRLARALNRLWRRVGAVFEGRFHARSLSKPRDVRNVLVDVLLNTLHHGQRLANGIDPFSSGRWFDGWDPLAVPPLPEQGKSPLPAARTCLLSTGWKHWGQIDPRQCDS
jgi:REP element-mobilizing transposase RayT